MEQDINSHSSEYMLNKFMKKISKENSVVKPPQKDMCQVMHVSVAQCLFLQNIVKSQYNIFLIMHILSQAAHAQMHTYFHISFFGSANFRGKSFE
jgi:hypothetical protein